MRISGTFASCRNMSVQLGCAHGGAQQAQQAGAAAFQLQRAPVGRIVQQAAAVQLLQRVAAAVALAPCTLRQQVAPPTKASTPPSCTIHGETKATSEQDHPYRISAALHPHMWCSCVTLERGVTFPACPCAWHARGASPACAGLRPADRALQVRPHSSAPRPPAAALAAAAWHARLAAVLLLVLHLQLWTCQ